MTRVRAWDPARDLAAVRALFGELHETERRIDPRMRPTGAIADAYLAQMQARCEDWDGAVLVAEEGDAVVGYVCVYRRYVSEELDDPPDETGYVSDLVVAEAARGRGIGRALLRAAEACVREAGVASVRLSVLAGNDGAIALYEAQGFTPVELELEKKLGD